MSPNCNLTRAMAGRITGACPIIMLKMKPRPSACSAVSRHGRPSAVAAQAMPATASQA